jgi:chromosome partitioning protein
MGDIDIASTRKLVQEIYGSLTKFGTKSFLLWNRVAGYCFPDGFLGDTKPEPKISSFNRFSETSNFL